MGEGRIPTPSGWGVVKLNLHDFASDLSKAGQRCQKSIAPGAEVRSTATFMTFCATKLSDAQQKPSSNRRIAGSKTPKLRNRVHCQQTISALGESQAKHIRQKILSVTFYAAIIRCRNKFLFFCLLETFTSRKSNLATAINSLIIY